MTRVLATVAAVCLGLAAAATGCGNTDTTATPAPQSEPVVEDAAPRDATDKVPGYSVSQQDVYDLANVACSLPAHRVAHDFHMRTTDPVALAERYARGYAAPLRQSAYEGCFDGLSR